MYISIGRLRQRVTIERPIILTDEEGNLIEQERRVYTIVWAKVLPFAAKISDGYAEKVSEVDYRVAIRYRADIQATDILVWRGRRMALISTPYDMDGRKKWLVMECRELVEDGE